MMEILHLMLNPAFLEEDKDPLIKTKAQRLLEMVFNNIKAEWDQIKN